MSQGHVDPVATDLFSPVSGGGDISSGNCHKGDAKLTVILVPMSGWLPFVVRTSLEGDDAKEQAARPKPKRNLGACPSCRTARAKCDTDRPCRRCIFKGIQDQCNNTAQSERSEGNGGGRSRSASPPPPSIKRARLTSNDRTSIVSPMDGTEGHGIEASGEYFTVGIETMEAISISPALARHYCKMGFCGPAGSIVTSWFYPPDGVRLAQAVQGFGRAWSSSPDQVVVSRVQLLVPQSPEVMQTCLCDLTVTRSPGRGAATTVDLYVTWCEGRRSSYSSCTQAFKDRSPFEAPHTNCRSLFCGMHSCSTKISSHDTFLILAIACAP